MSGTSGCPVLFLVFNRVNEALSALGQIRRARPERVFIAADGPRAAVNGEAQKCDQVRARVLEAIDWPCEVATKFSAVNQGCKLAVSSAISWFFRQVEQGIILEDDCVPDESFFPFMQAMLDKYRDNPRIAHIGGFNCQNGIVRGRSSYYFSRYFHVWGWATWRRAWKAYSLEMEDYPEFLADGALERLFPQQEIAAFWRANFDRVYSGALDTWDFQWVYLNMKRDALSIVPSVNLVHNVGFNEAATHTKGADESITSNVAKSLDAESLVHPAYVLADSRADLFTYTDHCGIDLSGKKENGLIRLLKKAKRAASRVRRPRA